MSETQIYIAGPMTGYPDFNYPAFEEAEARLATAGFKVLSPHRNGDGDTTKPWDWYMRAALKQLVSCDAVALLDGWQQSRGASLEQHVATAIGIECRHLDHWLTEAHP